MRSNLEPGCAVAPPNRSIAWLRLRRAGGAGRRGSIATALLLFVALPARSQIVGCATDSGGAWACIEVPFAAAPSPGAASGAGEPAVVTRLDVYLVGSGVRPGSSGTTVGVALDWATCPPAGSGPPDACIADVWLGAALSERTNLHPFVSYLDVQPFTAASRAALDDPQLPPQPPPDTLGQRLPLLAALSAATGRGSTSAGCAIDLPYPDRDCSGTAAGAGAAGYGCFRPDSLPLVAVVSSEPLASGPVLGCPSLAAAAAAARDRGVKLAVIYGEDLYMDYLDPEPILDEYRALASGSGLVTSSDYSTLAPILAFDDADDLRFGLSKLLRTIARDALLTNVHAELVDDPTDAVDVTQFVDHLEVDPTADASCEQGAPLGDRDGDGLPDAYDALRSHAIPCWRIVARQNLTVPTPGVYAATLRVESENAHLHDLPLRFVVPGDISSVPPAEIFLGGFETGTTCRWTQSIGAGSCS